MDDLFEEESGGDSNVAMCVGLRGELVRGIVNCNIASRSTLCRQPAKSNIAPEYWHRYTNRLGWYFQPYLVPVLTCATRQSRSGTIAPMMCFNFVLPVER